MQSKIDKRSVAFLRDNKNVEHAYNYIKDKVPIISILKYTQDISFDSTSDKSNYILAVLDYWNFEKLWGSNNLAQLNGKVDEQTREEFIKKIKDACNSKNSRDRAKKLKQTGLELTKQNKENLRYLAKSHGKTQQDILNELVGLAYNQTRNQEIQLNSSFPNQDAFFDGIPQTHSSSMQSEEKPIPKETSRVEDKEKPNNTYGDLLGYSTPYIDKYVLNETVETSQTKGLIKPFYPQESRDKQTVNEQNSAELNAQIIADKEAKRLR
jgi:hypothetical protein